MVIRPAVIVHGLAQAQSVLAAGAPVTLLSAPGAGIYGGCLWWRALVGAAQAAVPAADMLDVLDCADASGLAMAALRVGVSRVVLWPEAPAWASVARLAEAQGGFVLQEAPAALDMAAPGADRQLHGWLRKTGFEVPVTGQHG